MDRRRDSRNSVVDVNESLTDYVKYQIFKAREAIILIKNVVQISIWLSYLGHLEEKYPFFFKSDEKIFTVSFFATPTLRAPQQDDEESCSNFVNEAHCIVALALWCVQDKDH